ncbi:hypothetical protein GCM10010145_04150 [Streptomyces ruber]|uniref:NACHT domain-containing protein n=2 Tax=Streptomyces TaxID=1883 RepID=A0A918BAH9_9ACTN|nr:WD40 repeat domain-containing protein [Streptomyces ruber]GGQ39621.1 hypothetical protein GCM10010145_04150 [Streptomyces ruber]
MATEPLQRSDPLSSVLSFFVGCAGLALSLADYFRSREVPPPDPAVLADELCRSVRLQWTDEARSRRLNDPRVLPLAWASTRRRVADRSEILIPADRTTATALPAFARRPRVVRQRLDGRLGSSFDAACAALANGYRGIPSRRLLLLGEPGAGKSALALMVTLGLTAENHRTAGGPVPVLLSVGSWDPVLESLDEWMVRRLADMYYSGRCGTPRLLLDQGLLIPVLDGLDEIPEVARRGAVRGVNGVLGCDRPVIVTCRSEEYEDVVKDGAPRLRGAPVIEIAPVAPDDAIAYLSDVTWPEETDWTPVYEALRERPGSAVAEALSTPLMVSLARMAFERTAWEGAGDSPAVLVDETRLDSRHAVEDYVTAKFVDSWRSGQAPAAADAAARSRRRNGGGREREWLTYLALYLHRHRERDLVWWRMPERLLSAWAGPSVALVGGLLLTVTVTALLTPEGTPTDPEEASAVRQSSLGSGMAVGAGFLILAMVVWWISSGRAPGRISLRAPGTLGRLRAGFRSGWSFTALPAGCVLAGTAAVALTGSNAREGVDTLLPAVGYVWTTVMAAAIGLSAHEWLSAAPVTAISSHPASSLRDDRRSALAGAAACGLAAGLTVFPLLVAYMVVLDLITSVATGLRGEPSLTELVLLHAQQVAASFGGYYEGRWHWAPFVYGSMLTCCCIGLLALLPRAWTRFLIFRIAAAATHNLPWRLMDFLERAHRGGILRHTGGHYQFRHIKIQDALSQGCTAAGPVTVPARATGAGSRTKLYCLLGATVLISTTTLAVHSTYPRDTSYLRFVPQHHVTVMKFVGTRLVMGDGRDTEVWDSVTGDPLPMADTPATHRARLRGHLPEEIVAHALSLDGHVVRGPGEAVTWIGKRPRLAFAPCRGPLEVWEAFPRDLVYREVKPSSHIRCHGVMAVSEDFGAVAGEGEDYSGSMNIRKIGDARVIHLEESLWPGQYPESAAFSPDGTYLAVGLSSGGLRIIDTSTRTRTRIGSATGHRATATALAFNADASRVAAYANGEVRIWDRHEWFKQSRIVAP